jgi:acetoin utilization deacetylase AcuC-like enzyme
MKAKHLHSIVSLCIIMLCFFRPTFSLAINAPSRMRQRPMRLFSAPSHVIQETLLDHSFAASRLGLDPSMNRFHAPIVNHEHYSFDDWPETHTFPMDKFKRLAHALTTTSRKTHVSSNLPRPLVKDHAHFFRPLDFHDIPMEWLAEPTGPICGTFLHRFLHNKLSDEEKRYIGFRGETGRPELIQRTVLEVAGTVLACQLAFHYGIASNVAGGTHHAHATGGAGYTILNDLAVAANFCTNELLNQGTVRGVDRVLMVDCDVHQGV